MKLEITRHTSLIVRGRLTFFDAGDFETNDKEVFDALIKSGDAKEIKKTTSTKKKASE